MLAMLESGQALGNLNSLIKQDIVFWGDARRAVEAHGGSLEKINGTFTVVKEAVKQNQNVMDTFSISTDLATSAMHGLSPALKDVGDVTKESGGIVKEATGQIDELKKKAGLVASPLEVMTGNFSGLSDIAEEVRKPLSQTSDLFDLVGSSGTAANEVLETFSLTLLDVRSSLDDVIQSLTGYGQILDQVIGKQDLLTTSLGGMVTGFNDLKTVLGLTTTAYDTHVKSIDKTKTAIDTVKSSLGNLIKEEENLRKKILGVNPKLNDEKKRLETLRTWANSATTAINDLASAQNSLASALRNVNGALDDQTTGLGSPTFTDPFSQSTRLHQKVQNPALLLDQGAVEEAVNSISGLMNLAGPSIEELFDSLQFIADFQGPVNPANATTALDQAIQDVSQISGLIAGVTAQEISRYEEIREGLRGLSGSIGNTINDLRLEFAGSKSYVINGWIRRVERNLFNAQKTGNVELALQSISKLTELRQQQFAAEKETLEYSIRLQEEAKGLVQEQIDLQRKLAGSLRETAMGIGSTLDQLRFGGLAREIGGTNVIDQTRLARERFQGLVADARGLSGQALIDRAKEIESFAGTLLNLGKTPAQQVPEFKDLFQEVFGSLEDIQSRVVTDAIAMERDIRDRLQPQVTQIDNQIIGFSASIEQLEGNLINHLVALQDEAGAQADLATQFIDTLQNDTNTLLSDIATQLEDLNKRVIRFEDAQEILAGILDILREGGFAPPPNWAELLELEFGSRFSTRGEELNITLNLDGKQVAKQMLQLSREGVKVVDRRGVADRITTRG